MLERRTLCPFKSGFLHKKINLKSLKLNNLQIVENVYMGIPLPETLMVLENDKSLTPLNNTELIAFIDMMVTENEMLRADNVYVDCNQTLAKSTDIQWDKPVIVRTAKPTNSMIHVLDSINSRAIFNKFRNKDIWIDTNESEVAITLATNIIDSIMTVYIISSDDYRLGWLKTQFNIKG